MFHAGLVVNSPYTPAQVVESLWTYSPSHTPGYFVLLNIWSNLISYDVAVARVFGIFCTLLTLSMTYRLGRDFFGPAAGLFAIIIIASNTFSNFFIAYIRMYALLLLMTGVVLWLYLRLISRRKNKRGDLFCFFLAVFTYLTIHAFSVAFLLTLVLYHLLIAKKQRKWLQIAIPFCVAGLCAAPMYFFISTRGAAHALKDWNANASSTSDVLHTWISLMTNDQPLLLIIPLLGFAFAIMTGRFQFKTFAVLVIIQLLLIAFLHKTTPYIITDRLRYLLPSFVLMALFMAAGLWYLYSTRRAFCTLLALWVISGVSFLSPTDWDSYLEVSSWAYDYPPWQVISRLASDQQINPVIIPFLTRLTLLHSDGILPYNQQQHFFDNRGLKLLKRFTVYARDLSFAEDSLVQPSIWILFPEVDSIRHDLQAIAEKLYNLNYVYCQTIPIGTSWAIKTYSWSILNCEDSLPTIVSRNRLINHSFYSVSLDSDSRNLYFVDAWNKRAEFDHHQFSVSYQLVSEDWNNVAQLDLPMVHEGMLRRFSIDLNHVTTGNYRLMLILYDAITGDRFAWEGNPGDVPEMLELDSITIRES